MGQYYIIVNLTKGEYINPHDIRCSAKLREMTMFGAYLLGLLTNDNGRGMGDYEEHPIWGRWAGDRIVVAGDYGDKGEWLTDAAKSLKRELKEEEVDMTLYEYIRKFGLSITKLLPDEGM